MTGADSMTAVTAPTGYRTFYLGKGKVVHAAQDSDTVTLCKKPITTVRLAHTPYVSCTQCAKVALKMITDEPSGNGGERDMPKAGAKLVWRLTFQYATQEKASTNAHYDAESAERAADEMLETARRNDSSVTITISNRETGESYAYPKENDTMAAAPKKDNDELISDVHAKVDEIKALDPKAEGAADQAKTLYDDAEKIVRKLPTEKRNSLRSDMREARDAVVNGAQPADAAPAPAPSTAIVRQAEDPMEIEGIPDLVKQSIKAFKDGVKYGLKLSEVGETVARTMLEMRLKMTHGASGLPDLMSIEKKTKNSAGLVYDGAREGMDPTDQKLKDAHDALQKATQNKMADILVGWLRDFGSSPNPEEAMETARLYFPDAVTMVEEAREAKESGADVADADLDLTEAIYAVYKDAGIELPRYGRTEIQRFNYRVKQLDTARAELDAARDALDEDGVSDADKEKLTAKVAELEEKAKGITEEIPAEWTEKATPEKTPKQRATEKVARAQKLTDSVTKSVRRLEGAERQEVSTSLVQLGRQLITNATADTSKLSDDEKADLKSQLESLVTVLAGEAAKL
jgi:murein DD-endopeptidase MepM/ murein hydrolase activator NlpD